VLFSESKFATLQCKLVGEKKLYGYQQKTYVNIPTNTFKLWDLFKEKQINAKELLEKLGEQTSIAID
jgi:hypothetical protein